MRLFLCVVNWGEVYYGMWRAGGRAAADDVAADLSRMPIELVEADLHLTKQAAIYKATNKMSYADAFAAALAKIKNAELSPATPNSSRRKGNQNQLAEITTRESNEQQSEEGTLSHSHAGGQRNRNRPHPN